MGKVNKPKIIKKIISDLLHPEVWYDYTRNSDAVYAIMPYEIYSDIFKNLNKLGYGNDLASFVKDNLSLMNLYGFSIKNGIYLTYKNDICILTPYR